MSDDRNAGIRLDVLHDLTDDLPPELVVEVRAIVNKLARDPDRTVRGYAEFIRAPTSTSRITAGGRVGK